MPGAPAILTGPSMRLIRKTRGAFRLGSWPATYHRPRRLTTPHGSSSRLITSERPPAWWLKVTGRRSRTASQSGPKAGSWWQPRLDGPGRAPSSSPSTSLAAFSLSSAPAAAPASSADCQTRAAMPSTAASSGARWISGSS